MTIIELQQKVDDWIREYGVRYFDIKTNALLLSEEVGEFSSLIAREYGEQSYKSNIKQDPKERISEELADILFVATCIANQLDIDLTSSISSNLEKKTKRDRSWHLKNEKLKS